ncbi:hypothetical protein ACFVZP_21910, partial [Streptomyces bottropensis]
MGEVDADILLTVEVEDRLTLDFCNARVPGGAAGYDPYPFHHPRHQPAGHPRHRRAGRAEARPPHVRPAAAGEGDERGRDLQNRGVGGARPRGPASVRR